MFFWLTKYSTVYRQYTSKAARSYLPIPRAMQVHYSQMSIRERMLLAKITGYL